MNVILRPLQENDIETACRLLKRGMPEKEYSHTIFACSGYPDYLRASSRCGPNAATLLIGAYAEERLLGFAEWRRLEQMLVLNNLNVEGECRSQGIGRRLVAYGEALAREEGVRTLALDVFAWNRLAYDWYRRLGFVESGRTYWYEGELELQECDGRPGGPFPGEPVQFVIEDYPMAEAHHAAYGFSSFKLRTSQGTAQVGRLGDRYYRIQAKDGEWDPGGRWTRMLLELGTGRRLLVLSPDAHLADADPRLVRLSESVRMIRMLEKEAGLYDAN